MISSITIILIKAMMIVVSFMLFVPAASYFERRNMIFLRKRMSFSHLLHPMAVFFKFLLKEERKSVHVRTYFYWMIPFVVFVISVTPFLGIPLCEPFYDGHNKIYPEIFRPANDLFCIFMLICLGFYSSFFAGWASDSKYSIIGSVKSFVQLMSYMFPIVFVIITLFFIHGSSDIHQIVHGQTDLFFNLIPAWGIIKQPIAGFVFLISMFIMNDRHPFDLVDNDSERILDFDVEYSTTKAAVFHMVKYINLFSCCCFFVLLFLGGYNLLPGFLFFVKYAPTSLYFFQVISILVKSIVMLYLFSWAKYAFPRLKYGQLIQLGWKRLMFLGLANLLVTVLVIYYLNRAGQ